MTANPIAETATQLTARLLSPTGGPCRFGDMKNLIRWWYNKCVGDLTFFWSLSRSCLQPPPSEFVPPTTAAR